MANLTENPTYSASIFKIETTTPVQGGDVVFNESGAPIAGYDNVQGQQLANRTAYLKGQTDSIPTQISDAITSLKAEADPFDQYVLESTIAQPSGVCDLDVTGQVPVGRLGNVPASGEVNTASNLGAGEGVFAAKVGTDLQFKSLIEGTNVSITSDADTITITSTAVSGIDIQDEAVPVETATTINFTGPNVVASSPSPGVVNVTITAGAGGGDVVGPVSSVDNGVALFDGVTGELLKDGGVLGDAAFATIGVDIQEQLVSGTNIKTVNGNSLLGAGNIAVSGGSSTIDGSNVVNFTAVENTTYWLGSSLTVTLPDTTVAPAIGAYVRFLKTHSATPIIQVGAGSAVIQTTEGSDSSVIYNINSEIVFVFNGTDWEI